MGLRLGDFAELRLEQTVILLQGCNRSAARPCTAALRLQPDYPKLSTCLGRSASSLAGGALMGLALVGRGSPSHVDSGSNRDDPVSVEVKHKRS